MKIETHIEIIKIIDSILFDIILEMSLDFSPISLERAYFHNNNFILILYLVRVVE